MTQQSPQDTAVHWHLQDAHELACQHGVDPAHGLNEEEASRRAERHGPNEILARPGRSLLGQFIDQFKDFMVLVLIGAAVVSGVVGDLVDTVAILVIVLLNAIIGFVQIWQANRAMAALQQLAAAQATVLRGGQAQVIAASALVPGDIVLLEAGNKVPADLRLIEIAQLKVDESALTGESVTVEKHARVLSGLVHALGDRLNMALGKVAGLLDRESDRTTPLQLRLAAFGKRLALAVIAICVVIFLVGVLRGEDPVLMILTAVSLAVAAIPEALPAVVTVLLAPGPARAAGEPVCAGDVAAHFVGGFVDWWSVPAGASLGAVHRPGALADHGVHGTHLVADGARAGYSL
jgi:Ca2+-transporting ATPase